jgi:hypothetical protein
MDPTLQAVSVDISSFSDRLAKVGGITSWIFVIKGAARRVAPWICEGGIVVGIEEGFHDNSHVTVFINSARQFARRGT